MTEYEMNPKVKYYLYTTWIFFCLQIWNRFTISCMYIAAEHLRDMKITPQAKYNRIYEVVRALFSVAINMPLFRENESKVICSVHVVSDECG